MGVALCVNTVVQIGGGWLSRTDHPDINPWHLRAPVTLVCNVTFITLSSKKPRDPSSLWM